jgi:hypothetical protein
VFVAGDAVASAGSVAAGKDVAALWVGWAETCVAAAGPQAETSRANTSKAPSKTVRFILFLSFRSIGKKFTKVFNGRKIIAAWGIFPIYENSKIKFNFLYPELI